MPNVDHALFQLDNSHSARWADPSRLLQEQGGLSAHGAVVQAGPRQESRAVQRRHVPRGQDQLHRRPSRASHGIAKPQQQTCTCRRQGRDAGGECRPGPHEDVHQCCAQRKVERVSPKLCYLGNLYLPFPH